MDFSILIVTRNRKVDLEITLSNIYSLICDNLEILVFIDAGTDNTIELKDKFPEISWYKSDVNLGCPASRHKLHKYAKGKYLISFDDDSNALTNGFLELIKCKFLSEPDLGILALRIIWGRNISIVNIDNIKLEEEFYCKDFIGCGVVIRKECYIDSGGYPDWMMKGSGYGEETYLSLKAFNSGWKIKYFPGVIVHHRVDVINRNQLKWFEIQLYNELGNSLTLYPYPYNIKRIFRLIEHNFKKYALYSFKYSFIFWKVVFNFIIKAPSFIRTNSVINKSTFKKWNTLPNCIYNSKI